MTKFINTIISLIVVHGGCTLLGCSDNIDSGTDAGTEGEPSEVPPMVVDQDEIDAFRERFEREHGPVRPRDRDEPIRIDPYEEEPEHEETDEQDLDKAVVFPAHGWAQSGTVVRQRTGQTPKAHCELFGLSCDNQNHTQINVTSMTDKWDFLMGNRGRCGRFDSAKDNSWQPCMFPNVYPTTVGQTWTFRWDMSSCPNDSVARGVLRWGMDRALEQIEADTNLEFVEVSTNNQNILFRCEELAGVDPYALMIGYPTGNINLKFAAGQAAEEVCDDSSWPPSPTDGTGNFTYMMTDMMYSYSRAVVGIDWDFLWATMISCSGNGTEQGYMARNIFLHEVGHVFGFQHQNWSPRNVRGVASYPNIMRSTLSCGDMQHRGTHWNGRMSWGIDSLDMRTGSDLTIVDEDISCLFPQ